MYCFRWHCWLIRAYKSTHSDSLSVEAQNNKLTVDTAQYCRHDFLMRQESDRVADKLCNEEFLLLIKKAAILIFELRVVKVPPTFQPEIPTQSALKFENLYSTTLRCDALLAGSTDSNNLISLL